MFNSFFDADFRYLDDPKNEYHDPIFDCLHRNHLGDCWLFSLGGEERLRLMDSQNDRLSGQNNRYMLERTRVYGDLWYSNLFRAYVEFIDARSYYENALSSWNPKFRTSAGAPVDPYVSILSLLYLNLVCLGHVVQYIEDDDGIGAAELRAANIAL